MQLFTSSQGTRSTRSTHAAGTSRAAQTQDRLYGIDTLRALATLLVVALHAAVPYTLRPLPGLAWPTRSSQHSALLDAAFWWIEGFIMPLFFLMSGYFAAQTLGSRGAAALVVSRVRRLLVPLAWGCVLILPMELYIWMTGWYLRGLIPLRKLQSLKLPPELSRNLWGLSHLWYLQYVFLFCLLAAGFSLYRVRRRQLPANHRASGDETAAPLSGRRPLRVEFVAGACFVLCGLVLWWAPEVVTAFQHGFLPYTPKFLHGAIFFTSGWLLRRSPIRSWRRPALLSLLVSAAVFVWLLPQLRTDGIETVHGVDRLLLGLGLSLFATTAAFGCLGVFANLDASPAPGLQRIAQSSLWIYLLHHPIVGVMHVLLIGSRLPAEWQFATVWAAAVSLPMLVHRRMSSHPHRWIRRMTPKAAVTAAARPTDRRAA